MKDATAEKLGLDWLVHSNIRHANGSRLVRGGVNQGYDWQRRQYTFVYSEITGYAVSAFVNAYRWTGEEDLVVMAQQSAAFLLGVQRLAKGAAADGAIPQGLSLPDLDVKHQYYSFDAAMCLQGLMDLHDHSPTLELRRAGQSVGDWLLERMQLERGAFLCMYDAVEESWQRGDDDLFGDGGCLHAKHAIGLLKLGSATADDRYNAAARKVCDWVLGLQDDDGAFRATERVRQIVSHPHCYATEGLLFAFYRLGTERHLAAARRAAEWLLSVQNRDGSINIAYKRRWWRMGRRLTETLRPRRVTDATAQAMRIWLIFYYIDGNQQFLDACHRAEAFINSMQCVSSSDPDALGGFYFWPGHAIMFAWCSMFAIHALYAVKHLDRENGYDCIMRELF